ncbi:MAG: tetratricopeptide repeat protein [Candidatus Omnitrophica bacterium]|nr:tetratricopeptide repeat protein [Candidatus Omnitrophota bacterium]
MNNNKNVIASNQRDSRGRPLCLPVTSGRPQGVAPTFENILPRNNGYWVSSDVLHRLRKLFVVLAFASLILGCQSGEYKAEKAFYEASKILKEIKRQGFDQAKASEVLTPAIQAFQAVVEKYPSTTKAAESLFIVADLEVQQGKLDEARSALEKVVQNFTGKGTLASEARFRIAQIYEKQGNWDKAEAMYWETATYHPWENKGMYAPLVLIAHYKQEGKKGSENVAYVKAVDHFEKMLKEAGPIKSAAMLKYFSGLVHMANEEWEKAATAWLELPKEFPESPYAALSFLSAGESFLKIKKTDRAVETYKLFLEKYPTHAQFGEATMRLGLIYQGMGQFETARSWYEKAVKHYEAKEKPRALDAKLLIGRSFQEEGHWEKAEEIYKSIEVEYPKSPAALQIPLLVAHHYETIGKKKEADEELSKAIERYQNLEEGLIPGTLGAGYTRRALVTAYAQKGEWDKVAASLEEDYQKEQIPGKKANFLFLKGLVVENRLQDANQALSIYKNFLKEYPQHPLAQLAERHIQSLSSANSVQK